MKYVFGPVPSRRLGQSLGIDTIPLKTCNWNCVYCQLGRTQPVTNERKEYFPTQEILTEVKEALDAHKPGEIDWVTFVGSGEPLLHSKIGYLIRRVKGLTDLPVAVITNGSLLYLPEVWGELAAADAVLPTLGAGTEKLYRQINRPHADITFERLIQWLIALRREYRGKLWVEVMLVKGLNDSDEALSKIAFILKRVQPDEVHINLPTRPPAEAWVQPPTEEGLMRARAILGDVAQVVHPSEGEFDLSGYASVVDAIIGIITRHPMRQVELERTLDRWSPGQVSQALADLEASGQAQVVERFGTRFWSAAPSHYPEKAHSRRVMPGYQNRSKREPGGKLAV
ncbi:MAG TPA: radical SAM protein [Anaerolineales bacterium]|jgi:wyosine [tRNA(Phe)-imidazoG37] synthetase (radical SAM superfamily)|nr:radical SAM protein [Anaerolineales bacterium]